MRSKGSVVLPILAAIIGVFVPAAACGFLALVGQLQNELFLRLPHGVGLSAQAPWWPKPVLAEGGILTAPAIVCPPGIGGESPAGGFKVHKPPAPALLPAVPRAATRIGVSRRPR